MKITESQLRRIVRRLVSEAPLADLADPKYIESPASRFFYGKQTYSDTNLEKARKIFSSKSFRTKLEKLLMNWPIDVWVSPQIPTEFSSVFPERMEIYEPEEIISGKFEKESSEDFDPDYDSDVGDIPRGGFRELKSATEEWLQKSGGGSNSTLIIAYRSSGPSLGQEITPWMILHAMFDSDYEQNFVEDSEYIIGLIDSVKLAIRKLQEVLGISQVSAEMIEQVFTMGSARARYFSKIPIRFDLRDMPNEAIVQSLTTRGFRYNPDALDVIRERLEDSDDPSLLANVDDAQMLLDKAVSLSERAKSEFFSLITGKVLIVDA